MRCSGLYIWCSNFENYKIQFEPQFLHWVWGIWPVRCNTNPSTTVEQLWCQLCPILTPCLPPYWPHGPFTPDYFLNKYNFYVNIWTLIQECIQYDQAPQPVDPGPVPLRVLGSIHTKPWLKRKQKRSKNKRQTSKKNLLLLLLSFGVYGL